MAQKVEAQGGKGGNQWDDGSQHDAVTKIQAAPGANAIQYVQFTYVKNGQTDDQEAPLRGVKGRSIAAEPFVINHPEEHLESVEGWYNSEGLIHGIKFNSNEKTSGLIGYESGTPFTLQVQDKKIIGFHGFAGDYVHSLGAYFAPRAYVARLYQWDDGSEHDAVTKIQAAPGANAIQYVQFTYVKNGQPDEEAPLRGVKGRSIPAEFVISHPEEHLVSVEGWSNPQGLVHGLKFNSNKKTSNLIGYENGTPFTLQVQDKKIIGFHGLTGDHVHSLGAHFAPLRSTPPLIQTIKVEARGGTGGASWNDGVHDGVRKVHVGQGEDGVSSFKVVYEKDSQEVEGGEHGEKTLLGFETFEVDADDYIVAVKVTHDKIYGQESDIITSITFYTFKGKASQPYGMETQKKFILKEKNGGKLVGFHGRAGDVLHALGAHFVVTATPLANPRKLLAIGGDEGTEWDDGAYDGVKKVYVGQSQDGISVVKFVYDKGAEAIIGGEHGKPTLLGFEEFELDYPSEYITSVDGTYDKIFGSKSSVITMLRFRTNKQISAPFGIEAGTPFEFKEEGHKIVGFHGKVGDLLHKFGVHVLPITN